MKLLPLILLASCSCASLRSGWVQVDFVEGKVSEYIVCQTRINSDGDITAKCVSMESVANKMAEDKKPKKEDPWSL